MGGFLLLPFLGDQWMAEVPPKRKFAPRLSTRLSIVKQGAALAGSGQLPARRDGGVAVSGLVDCVLQTPGGMVFLCQQ